MLILKKNVHLDLSHIENESLSYYITTFWCTLRLLSNYEFSTTRTRRLNSFRDSGCVRTFNAHAFEVKSYEHYTFYRKPYPATEHSLAIKCVPPTLFIQFQHEMQRNHCWGEIKIIDVERTVDIWLK